LSSPKKGVNEHFDTLRIGLQRQILVIFIVVIYRRNYLSFSRGFHREINGISKVKLRYQNI